MNFKNSAGAMRDIRFDFDKVLVPVETECQTCGKGFMPREITPVIRYGESSLGYICPSCIAMGPNRLAETIEEHTGYILMEVNKLKEAAEALRGMECWPNDRETALAHGMAEIFLAEKEYAKKEWAFLEDMEQETLKLANYSGMRAWQTRQTSTGGSRISRRRCRRTRNSRP